MFRKYLPTVDWFFFERGIGESDVMTIIGTIMCAACVTGIFFGNMYHGESIAINRHERMQRMQKFRNMHPKVREFEILQRTHKAYK